MNLGYCQMGSPTLEVASLLDLASQFLPAPLPGKRLFCTSLVAGFEVVRMLLDVLNDVFLLHLALKPAQRAFDRLAFLHLDLSQTFPPTSFARRTLRSSRRATNAGSVPRSTDMLGYQPVAGADQA